MSYLSCEFKRLDKETQKLEGKKAVAAQERQANRRLKEEQQQILHTKNRLNCYPNEILYFNTVLFWITNMISKILLFKSKGRKLLLRRTSTEQAAAANLYRKK